METINQSTALSQRTTDDGRAQRATPPLATAYLRFSRRRQQYYWHVPRCPYCSREHWHGTGFPGDNPYLKLGYRMADCPQGSQYLLAAKEPESGRVWGRA